MRPETKSKKFGMPIPYMGPIDLCTTQQRLNLILTFLRIYYTWMTYIKHQLAHPFRFLESFPTNIDWKKPMWRTVKPFVKLKSFRETPLLLH